jgi:hypothetical protein
MQMEETTILPLAASVLQDTDWAAIDGAIPHIEDPLFSREEKRYGALRQRIARAARAPKADAASQA